MKFGKLLLRRAYGAWLHKHVSYKALKKLLTKLTAESDAKAVSTPVAAAGASAQQPQSPVPFNKELQHQQTEFLFALVAEARKVNDFYAARAAEYDARLRALLQLLVAALTPAANAAAAANANANANAAAAAPTPAATRALQLITVINHELSTAVASTATAPATPAVVEKKSPTAAVAAAVAAGASAGTSAASVPAAAAAVAVLQAIPNEPMSASVARCLAAVRELCREVDRLRAFVILNAIACYKILKKVDKKLHTTCKEAAMDNVYALDFYRSERLSQLLTSTALLTDVLSAFSSAAGVVTAAGAAGAAAASGPAKDDYTCAVCLDVLCAPVVLSCGHRFCGGCLLKTHTHARTHAHTGAVECCPVCRKRQSLHPADYGTSVSLQHAVRLFWPHECSTAQYVATCQATTVRRRAVVKPYSNAARSAQAQGQALAGASAKLTLHVSVTATTPVKVDAAGAGVGVRTPSTPHGHTPSSSSKSVSAGAADGEEMTRVLDFSIGDDEDDATSDVEDNAASGAHSPTQQQQQQQRTPRRDQLHAVASAGPGDEPLAMTDDVEGDGPEGVPRPVPAVPLPRATQQAVPRALPRPAPGMHAATSLAQIVSAHAVAGRGTLFVVDVDEVLITSKYAPCLMTTDEGVSAFELVLTTASTHAEAVGYANRFQHVLYEKRLVEGRDTALAIASLQQRPGDASAAAATATLPVTPGGPTPSGSAAAGVSAAPTTGSASLPPVTTTAPVGHGCWVMGLTSRYANIAQQTHNTLRSLGVDLSARPPFAPGVSIVDPLSGATYSQGVIYTNAQPKGPILERFLTGSVFSGNAAANAAKAAGVKSEATALPTAAGPTLLPGDVPPSQMPAIVFIDDRLSNVESVHRALQPLARATGVKTYAYHFSAPSCTAGAVPEDAPQTVKNDVLRVQIREFIYRSTVLNDVEARRMLQQPTPSPAPPQPQPQAQAHQQEGVVSSPAAVKSAAHASRSRHSAAAAAAAAAAAPARPVAMQDE